MFRNAAATIAVFTLIAGSAFAQGNGRNSTRNQGIPPGQMPPAGQCRVWYEGRPPGKAGHPDSSRVRPTATRRNGLPHAATTRA
jgi:hypothetical protein